jgi:hypothetical protein
MPAKPHKEKPRAEVAADAEVEKGKMLLGKKDSQPLGNPQIMRRKRSESCFLNKIFSSLPLRPLRPLREAIL